MFSIVILGLFAFAAMVSCEFLRGSDAITLPSSHYAPYTSTKTTTDLDLFTQYVNVVLGDLQSGNIMGKLCELANPEPIKFKSEAEEKHYVAFSNVIEKEINGLIAPFVGFATLMENEAESPAIKLFSNPETQKIMFEIYQSVTKNPALLESISSNVELNEEKLASLEKEYLPIVMPLLKEMANEKEVTEFANAVQKPFQELAEFAQKLSKSKEASKAGSHLSMKLKVKAINNAIVKTAAELVTAAEPVEGN